MILKHVMFSLKGRYPVRSIFPFFSKTYNRVLKKVTSNHKHKIWKGGRAPVGFLTPFPHRSLRRSLNSAHLYCAKQVESQKDTFPFSLSLPCSDSRDRSAEPTPLELDAIRLNPPLCRFFHPFQIFPTWFLLIYQKLHKNHGNRNTKFCLRL